jgi:hypothetical protein
MKSKIFILLAIIIPLLFSCKDSPCDINTSSLLEIRFYKLVNKVATSSLDTLSVYGIGKEGYLLYKDSSVVSYIYLPLSMNRDSSSFVLNSNGKFLDTLTINYSRHLQLISKECGFATIFDITKVNLSKHRFDSLKVINTTVSTNYGENIKIFL